MPVNVDPNGLPYAPGPLAGQVSNTTSITCRYEGADDIRVSITETATHLFRIAQKAVQIADTHTGATHIDLALTHDMWRLVLTVRDDHGKGFD